MAHAEAAIGLVNEDAGEAQFGELLPQGMAEAVLAIGVAPMAQLLGNRAFAGHELARGIGEHRLVFGVIERHFSTPCSSSRT